MTLSRPALVKIAAALALAGLWWLAVRHISLESVLGQYEGALGLVRDRWLISLLAYILIYTIVAGAGLPVAALLTLIGGALFGWFFGGLATVIGATAGACALFVAARGSLNNYFQASSQPWLARVGTGFKADAASFLLFARLTPVFPFMVVTLAAALLGARFSTFAWTTLIGIMPGTFAYALIGSGLTQTLGQQAQALRDCRAAGTPQCSVNLDVSALVSPKLAIGLAALGCVMLISALIRRRNARTRNGMQPDRD